MVAEIQKIETAARMAMGNFEIPSQKMPTARARYRAATPIVLAALAVLAIGMLALS